jgi:hypothetical protein
MMTDWLVARLESTAADSWRAQAMHATLDAVTHAKPALRCRRVGIGCISSRRTVANSARTVIRHAVDFCCRFAAAAHGFAAV